MVVVYQTASEGSWASFFVQTPRIIFHRRGSIIPKVWPQVFLVVGMAVMARWWNPLVNAGADVQNGMSIMSILLSFLVVFKTNSAYNQYFTALGHSEKLLHTLRDVVMTACTFFPTDRQSGATVRSPFSFSSSCTSPSTTTTATGTESSPLPPLLPDWSGGVLRVRVLAAFQLQKPKGPVSKPYTVVRVGSECSKTSCAEDPQYPTWNSEVFQFLLGSDDHLVSFVVLGSDKLGWLHLSSSEVINLPEQRWQRIRRRLQDGGLGELELEVSFTSRHSNAGQSLPPLEGGCTRKLMPMDEIKAFLSGVALDHCYQLLVDAGFTSMQALECIEDRDMDEIGFTIADRSVLRRRLHERKSANQSRGNLMPVNAFLRRTVRYIALYYFVVVEYFRRTGFNAVGGCASQDKMREDIKTLTGDKEFAILYPGDTKETPGSKSKHANANPMVVLYWIQFNISSCAQAHNIPSPVAAAMIPKISNLGATFCDMNKIDKLQFPLPYAQVVKILCIVFVFLTPWVLQPHCKDLTELVVGLIAMGFFGLDEVAEIIESPFGNDCNHINLRCYGEHLLDDLDMIYYSRESREKQLDTVFTEEEVRQRNRLFVHKLCTSVRGEEDEEEDELPGNGRLSPSNFLNRSMSMLIGRKGDTNDEEKADGNRKGSKL